LSGTGFASAENFNMFRDNRAYSLDGSMDLVEIYDYAWTAEQVSNDYNNQTYKDVTDGLILNSYGSHGTFASVS